MNPYSVCENWYPIAKSLHSLVGLLYYFVYSFYTLKEHRICSSARNDRVVISCPRMIAGVPLGCRAHVLRRAFRAQPRQRSAN